MELLFFFVLFFKGTLHVVTGFIIQLYSMIVKTVQLYSGKSGVLFVTETWLVSSIQQLTTSTVINSRLFYINMTAKIFVLFTKYSIHKTKIFVHFSVLIIHR